MIQNRQFFGAQPSLWSNSHKSVHLQCRRRSFIPESGRSPGEENGNPLQYSCLENPMDRGAWEAAVHGVAKSRTWLSNLNFPFLSFNLSMTDFQWCRNFWDDPAGRQVIWAQASRLTHLWCLSTKALEICTHKLPLIFELCCEDESLPGNKAHR